MLLTLRITRSENDDVFILVVILAAQGREVWAEQIDGCRLARKFTLNIYLRRRDQSVVRMSPDKILRSKRAKKQKKIRRGKEKRDDGKSLDRGNSPSIWEAMKLRPLRNAC